MLNKEECFTVYNATTNNISYSDYCPTIFDGFLCWPATPAGQNATLPCPRVKFSDPSNFAHRICLTNGEWDYNNKTELLGKGYTNYQQCFLPVYRELMRICYAMNYGSCLQITNRTRIIEMIGLSLSLITLLVSLFIFCHYRVLKNNRTKIHKNLFIATVLQVIMRLVIYVDQSLKGKLINNTDYLCETCYVLLEYAKTAMFMWMFIEGLYLHNMITVMVFQEYMYVKLYLYLGWGFPALITIAWLVTMILSSFKRNWHLYYLLPYYWILEGPRSAVIVVNMLFLLNIIRVLIVKLRQSQTSEIVQVRKAVRAAIFLLPLMGIANILFLVDFRLFEKAWKFALWSYSTYFLTSFQGFFTAVLYCFLNGEVRIAIKNNFYVYMSIWNNNYKPCRNSTVISTIETEPVFRCEYNLNYNTRRTIEVSPITFMENEQPPSSTKV